MKFLLFTGLFANIFVFGVPARNSTELEEFDYDDQRGWSKLSPKCKNTKSPIDIDNSIEIATQPFKFNYVNAQATIVHDGHTIKMTFGGNTQQKLTFNSAEYTFKQLHFHAPAEHRIFQEFFPLEMHMVHQGPLNKTLVVGYTFDLQSENHNFNGFIQKVSSLIQHNQPVDIGTFRLKDVVQELDLSSRSSYYKYIGSLTTVPCTDDVQWLIGTHPGIFGVSQFNIIKTHMKYNGRYIEKMH